MKTLLVCMAVTALLALAAGVALAETIQAPTTGIFSRVPGGRT